MKIRSIITKFCKTCKTHKEMKLEKTKKGRARAHAWINRQKERAIGTSNKGKYSKPPKKVIKTSKSAYFQLVCYTCNHKRHHVLARTRKIEIVKVKRQI